jgi:hypothetical protein
MLAGAGVSDFGVYDLDPDHAGRGGCQQRCCHCRTCERNKPGRGSHESGVRTHRSQFCFDRHLLCPAHHRGDSLCPWHGLPLSVHGKAACAVSGVQPHSNRRRTNLADRGVRGPLGCIHRTFCGHHHTVGIACTHLRMGDAGADEVCFSGSNPFKRSCIRRGRCSCM